MQTSRLIAAATTVAALSLVSAAHADDLVVVDLTVENQVTLTALPGNSAATVTGSDGTGIYLENFFTSNIGDGFVDSSFAASNGDFTNALNPTDGTIGIFRATGGDAGLNFWTWSSDIDVDFTAGELAFTGSATWAVDADDFADLLAGNTSGDIFFPADTDDDVAGATLLGTYTVLVPEPTSLGLLGLGGLALARRRR